MSRFARFAANIRFNVYGQVLQAALPFFFVPFVLRNLGREAYGLYSLIGVLTAQLNLLSFGAGPATVKYLAEFHAAGDRSKTDRLIGNSLVFYGGTGLLGSALIVFLAPVFSGRLFHVSWALAPAARFVFLCAAGVFLLQSVARTYHAVPQALQRFDWWNGLETACSLVSYAGIYALLSRGYWLRALAAWSIGVAALNLALYAPLCARLLPRTRMRPSYDPEMMKRVTRFGGLVLVGQITWSVAHQLDKLVLGHYLPLADVTYYLVAFSLAQKLPLLISPILPILLPFSSTLHGQGDYAAAGKLYLSGTKWIMVVVWPMVVLGVFFAPAFLELWLGGQFSLNAGWVLRLLIVGTFMNLLPSVGNMICQGFERFREQIFIAVGCVAAEAACWPLMIPRWGLLAAAGIFCAGSTLNSILLFAFHVEVARVRGADLWRALLVPVGISVPVLAASVLLRNSLKTWTGLGAFGAAAYGAALLLSYYGAFNAEERGRIGQSFESKGPRAARA